MHGQRTRYIAVAVQIKVGCCQRLGRYAAIRGELSGERGRPCHLQRSGNVRVPVQVQFRGSELFESRRTVDDQIAGDRSASLVELAVRERFQLRVDDVHRGVDRRDVRRSIFQFKLMKLVILGLRCHLTQSGMKFLTCCHVGIRSFRFCHEEKLFLMSPQVQYQR